MIGPFVFEIGHFMCFFMLWKFYRSEIFYLIVKWKCVANRQILTFIEANFFRKSFLFEVERSMPENLPGYKSSISKRKDFRKKFASIKVNIWRFATIFHFIIRSKFSPQQKFFIITKHINCPISKTKGPIQEFFL